MTSSNSDSSPPSLEELGVSAASVLLLPLILTVGTLREVAVFVHQPTGSITVFEGHLDVLHVIQLKQGPLPVAEASIDAALPGVRVSDPGLECSICLSEFEVNGEAEVVKQMPCGHRFHAGCIGTCPVCRFSMPADESKFSGGSHHRGSGSGYGRSGYGSGSGPGKEEDTGMDFID